MTPLSIFFLVFLLVFLCAWRFILTRSPTKRIETLQWTHKRNENQGSRKYKHKRHKTQKCSLLCLYKTQTWFCVLWFCGTKVNENLCVLCYFWVVFCVRTQTQNQFFTRISSFDFSNVKKPVCKSLLKRNKLILVFKNPILAEKTSVLCFVFLRFVQSHFIFGGFVETQNTKRFCSFVYLYKS